MAPDGEHQNPIGADHGIRSLQDYPGLGANRAMPMCFSIPLRAEVLLLGRVELRL
jgi:hypothetical protein